MCTSFLRVPVATSYHACAVEGTTYVLPCIGGANDGRGSAWRATIQRQDESMSQCSAPLSSSRTLPHHPRTLSGEPCSLCELRHQLVARAYWQRDSIHPCTMGPVARRSRPAVGQVRILCSRSAHRYTIAHHSYTTPQGGAPLKGWDFIQERLLSHDENMIADFSDDIDTLLVFVSVSRLRRTLY